MDLGEGRSGGGVVFQDGVVRVALDGELVSVDPVTSEVVGRVPAIADVFLAADPEGVWASDFDGGVVRLIDPSTGQTPTTVSSGVAPTGVLVADESLWITNHRSGSVSRVDPSTGKVIATINLGRSGSSGPQTLAADASDIFVGVPNEESVIRISMRSNTVVATYRMPTGVVPCGAMTLQPKAIWITSCAETTKAARVDLDSGAVLATADLGGYAGVGVEHNGVVWLSVSRDDGSPDAARMVALDASGALVGELPLPTGGIDGAVGADAMWIAAPGGSLVKVPLSALPAI